MDDEQATGGQQQHALTIEQSAAELRSMAEEASEFGGLRDKLRKLASFAEAVAVENIRLRNEIESVRTFHEDAALEVAERLDQLGQALASRPS